MFYLIGAGLDLKSVSVDALEVLKRCRKIYLESYTVDFPYEVSDIERLGIRVIPMTRTMVEMEDFVEEAKLHDIALLVYGDPLAATTHISLILKCRKDKINYRVFHNSSILDAVAETGLQVYKFGKTASLPAWTESYKPASFADIIKDNKKIKAHSLILVDIGLNFHQALNQLIESCKKKSIGTGKIIACSKLGTKESKIYYESAEKLAGREIYPPFCFIIPEKMHFIEEEALESLREK